MSNDKCIEFVDCGSGDISEEQIREVATATQWEGDIRVNFTTTMNALRAAIKIIDEYSDEVDEMFQSGYGEGYKDGYSDGHYEGTQDCI